ncbi:hypothetical protein [Kitasatospora phosalacinea]|uniref:hypothetical protein n=1 Tax=Kitasatospora phosalacinea TaxID=2065 RepID=UPI000525D500|nr:hypothetical protein [Kitasatospora phosalacinea]
MDETPQGGAGGVPAGPDYAGDDYRAEGRPPTVRHDRRGEGWSFERDAERAAGDDRDAGEEREVEEDGPGEDRPDREEGDATTAEPGRARRLHPDEEGRPED